MKRRFAISFIPLSRKSFRNRSMEQKWITQVWNFTSNANKRKYHTIDSAFRNRAGFSSHTTGNAFTRLKNGRCTCWIVIDPQKHKHESFITVHCFQSCPCLLLGSKVNKAIILDFFNPFHFPELAKNLFYCLLSRAQ